MLEGYGSRALDILFEPLDPDVVRSKANVFVRVGRQNKLLRRQMTEPACRRDLTAAIQSRLAR